MIRPLCLAAALALLTGALGAQVADTATRIRFNGFIDTYYAWDSNRPVDGERQFTTQAVRHDEVNVNLAWLGVTVERRALRARFAIQAGTSVQVNYAGEPRSGPTSGPDVARMIQEAVVGVKLGDHAWVDGGVYLSYIGLEGWSSSDNPTYTRSLVADYSPYYLSGVKLTWQPTPRVTAQAHVMNGWQNIAENNRSKAVGGRIDVAVSPALTLSYANFFGNERPTGGSGVLRQFHQVMAKGVLPTGTQLQGQVDIGSQGGRRWDGLVGIARQPVSARVAVVGRLERYADPDQVIIGTGLLTGFTGTGGSLGVDVTLDEGVRWRSEVRELHTSSPLLAHGSAAIGSSRDRLLVTSLSLAF
ncbi:MAG: porin [Gemmatimonadaceae bacterium]|nr:porin [Gemmatimonadaceae bacterium]